MKTITTCGCFLFHDGKMLIVFRHPDKPQPETWGLPAGKMDPGETKEETMLRELKEETGFQATREQLQYLGGSDWQFPELFIHFHTFRIDLNKRFEPKLIPGEHTDAQWITPDECYAKPNLIPGLRAKLKMYDLTSKEVIEKVGFPKHVALPKHH